MQAFTHPLSAPDPIRMVVIGDSLAAGLGASGPENGIAYLLFDRVRKQRLGSTYVNFAVPHATMGDVLRVQVPKLSRLGAGLVLLIAGANDLRHTTDGEVVMRRFVRLLDAAHEAAPGAAFLVGGMPDVSQTVGVPAYLKAVAARLCRKVNERMRIEVQRRDDAFLDLFRFTHAPLCLGASYLCEDGYHPCDFGYHEIASRGMDALDLALTRLL